MRARLVVALTLIASACTGQISGPNGGDDVGQVCGDGQIEAGEQCDDSNTVAGDGCSATCQTEQNATPRVALSLDTTTVTTDLNVETSIVVTATSEMGYAGTVTLAATAVDNASAPITDWATTLDQTSLTLAAGGMATATLKVSAMGDTAALGGNLTITATGPASPATTTVGVTFNPVLDVTFLESTTDPGKCDYPANHSVNNPFQIKSGRTIKVINGATTLGLQVHTNGAIPSFPHEQMVTAPGDGYMHTVTYASGQDEDDFYCHDGTNTMTSPAGIPHPYLKVIP